MGQTSLGMNVKPEHVLYTRNKSLLCSFAIGSCDSVKKPINRSDCKYAFSNTKNP